MLNNACYKQKLDANLKAGMIARDAEAKARGDCTESSDGKDALVPFDEAKIPGCIDATAQRYEDAGMSPTFALSRAEEDCLAADVSPKQGSGKDASMGKRLGKHIDRHMTDGHGIATATAMAVQDCMAEDEASDDSEPDGDEKGYIPQEARDKMPLSEFADPKNRKYPIDTAAHLEAATHLYGKAPDADAIKKRIIAIAYRKGGAFVAALPDDWKRKSFDERLRGGLKSLGLLNEPAPAFDDGVNFKVVGSHWIATWTNNFKDRDDEIFPEREIDAYIRRVDLGIVPKPTLQIWHGGKSFQVGMTEQVAGHGHFGIAAGVFDDTAQGKAARDFYAKPANAKNTTISHGFTFPAKEFDGKHYKRFNTFEISLLPRGVEANLYTSLEGVKAMQISDSKKPYFEGVFGEKLFAQILETLDEKGKALTELGVEYKDFGDPLPEVSANDKAAQLEASLKELIPDVIEGQAEAIKAATDAIKEVKALRAEWTQWQKDMTPRQGTRERSTQIKSQDAPEIMKALQAQFVENDQFWGQEVRKSPNLNGTGGN